MDMWNKAAIAGTAQGVMANVKRDLVRRDGAPPEGLAQMLQGFDEIPGYPPDGRVGSLLHAESESFVNEIVRRSSNLVTFTARLGELEVALPVPQPREFYCLVTEDLSRVTGLQAEIPGGGPRLPNLEAQMLSILPRPFLARLADGVGGRAGALMPVPRQCGLGLASVNCLALLFEKHLYETAGEDKDAFKMSAMIHRTPARHLELFPPHGVIFEEDAPQPPPGSQLPAESYGGLQMQRSGSRGPTVTTIVKGRVTMYDYTNDHGTAEGNGVYLLARRHKYERGRTYTFGLIADGARGAPVSAGKYSITIPPGEDLYPVQYFIVHSPDHRTSQSLPHCEWGPHDGYPLDDGVPRKCYDAVSVPLGCVVQHNQTTLTVPLSAKMPQTPATLSPPVQNIGLVSKTYPTVVQLDMSASVCGV
jgi:hypothetical protein